MNNLLSVVALHKESESGGLECGNCESGDPPVNKCTSCLHFLCEFCTQAHRRGRGTSSHNLISLEEAKKMGSEAVKKPLFCKEHDGEMMKLFCETCEKAICRDCTIVKHRDHKYTFVKDAFSKRKGSLMEILFETKTKSSKLNEALDRVSDMKTSVQSCAEQTVQKVINSFDDLRALIDARRVELIRDIKDLKDAKLTSLELQQQDLKTAQGCIQSGVEFAEKAFENGSEAEILNMHRQMTSRLQELNAVQVKLEPCVDSIFKLRDDKVSRELEHEIAKFCVVTDAVAHAGISTVTMGHGQEGVMYNTLCGQPVEFKITARKESGTIITEGRDIFDVQIYSKEAEHLVTSLKVRSCSEYCFSHTPKKEGHYTLSVMLRDDHIKGSPFMWFVEKWKLISPFSSSDNQIHIQLSEDNLTGSYLHVHPNLSGLGGTSFGTNKRSPSFGSFGTLLGVSTSASLDGVTFAPITQASSFVSTSTSIGSSLFGGSAGTGSSTGGLSTIGTAFGSTGFGFGTVSASGASVQKGGIKQVGRTKTDKYKSPTPTLGKPVAASGLFGSSTGVPSFGSTTCLPTSGFTFVASTCANCFFGSITCSNCGSSVNTASTCSNCGLFGTGACSNCRSVHGTSTFAQPALGYGLSFSHQSSHSSTGGTPAFHPVGFNTGKHMWKVHIHGNVMDGFSFGLINASRQPNGKLIKLGNWWAWNSTQKQFPLLSGDQSATENTITHCASGDIIELYLDCEDGTLKMFNQHTKQSDTWVVVRGEVLPAFCMAAPGDKVSLKMQ